MPIYILFIFFALLSQAIIVVLHLLLYKFFLSIFPVASQSLKHFLLYILIFLSVSFIPTTILVHYVSNIFTSILYFISGLWYAMVVNLLLAILGSYLLFWLIKLIGLKINFSIIGICFIILALIYSFYGVYNATQVKIKEIEVSLSNLPARWEGKTVVFISDAHLGKVLGQRYAQKIVEKINILKPEMVFITGDYFDGMSNSSVTLARPLADIEASQGVYFVTGNHETYIDTKEALDALREDKINILDDEVKDIDGLLVVGLSYPLRNEKKDLSEEIKKLESYNSDQPSILLYHSPVQIEKVKKTGIDLMLAGHTHRGQIWPFNYITKLIFKGYDYGLYQEDDFNLYTTSGAGVWGPTMRTGSHNEIVVIRLKRK
jgi:predicted MPP superfamily phosphohydrolase